MKKSFLVIIILCFLMGANSNAQNSNSLASSNSRLKDKESESDNTKNNAPDTSGFNIHANDKRSNVMLGIKAGVNSSSVCNDIAGFKAEPVTGWVAGAFVTIPISRLLGFQSEFLYAQKGFKVKGTVIGYDYSFIRKSTYVDFPLLLQVKPDKCVSLFAGPNLSFLIHSKDTFNDGLITSEQKIVVSNGVINPNVLGAEAGIDIYIQKIIFSLRAGMDIRALNMKTASNQQPYENSWLQLTIGYNLF